MLLEGYRELIISLEEEERGVALRGGGGEGVKKKKLGRGVDRMVEGVRVGEDVVGASVEVERRLWTMLETMPDGK